MKQKNSNKDFKTPEGYFEGFSDRLLNRMSNETNEELASQLPKKEGFKMPDGYFDGLNKNIQNRIEKESTKVISLQSRKKWHYLAAASIAAIFIVAIGLNNIATEEPTFETLANTDIESYFDNNELGLSTIELAEVIPVDNLEIYDILDNHIQDTNIIDYLDDNVEDIEELNLTDYDY